jgi:hypothetical protein
MDGFVGDTAIDCKAIAFTVSVSAVLTTVPSIAVTWVAPAATPVAKPVVGPTVATDGLEDAQVAVVVMFLVLPSL